MPHPTQAYIPSIVVDGEDGHRQLTGDEKSHKAAWYWGDIDTANKIAGKENAGRGFSEMEWRKSSPSRSLRP